MGSAGDFPPGEKTSATTTQGVPVSSDRVIFHLRTGDAPLARTIAAWIRSHGATSIDCADVFEAALALLRPRGQSPELAFIGAAGLPREHLAIIRFMRETWPRIGLVAYGPGDLADALVGVRGVACCEDSAELAGLLKLPPPALAAALRCQTGRVVPGGPYDAKMVNLRPALGASQPARRRQSNGMPLRPRPSPIAIAPPAPPTRGVLRGGWPA